MPWGMKPGGRTLDAGGRSTDLEQQLHVLKVSAIEVGWVQCGQATVMNVDPIGGWHEAGAGDGAGTGAGAGAGAGARAGAVTGIGYGEGAGAGVGA